MLARAWGASARLPKEVECRPAVEERTPGLQPSCGVRVLRKVQKSLYVVPAGTELILAR